MLLRPEDQKRCCLGQVLGDQGVADQYLLYAKSPGSLSLSVSIPTSCQFLIDGSSSADYDYYNSKLAKNLMEINDTMALSPKLRESRLIEEFAKGGMEVEFYNPTIRLPRKQFGTVIADALAKLDLNVVLTD